MKSYQKLVITLTLPVEIAAETGIVVASDHGAIENALNQDSWNDGRYPFDEEQLLRGLKDMVDRAARTVVWNFLEGFHKGKTVTSADGKSTTALSVIKMDEWNRDNSYLVSFNWGEKKFKVKERKD